MNSEIHPSLVALKEHIRLSLNADSLYQVVLSDPKIKGKTQKINIRPIETKSGTVYQISEQQDEKVFHRNIEKSGLIDFLFNENIDDFKQVFYFTESADYQLLQSRKGQITVLKKAPSKQKKLLQHNRTKHYLLADGHPIDFLVHLGVMNADGRVYPKKMDKFKQINRFLEIIDDTLSELPQNKEFNILDFGSGKSYLTFALYYYLLEIKKISASIVGLDLKKDVIEFCNDLAQKLGYDKLKFEVGNIEGYLPKGNSIDMVICLHACNTATDAALENAIRWQAKIILAVPCCQHELYNQVKQSQLASLLRHGILKERFAALVTDAARAELLEINGYRCQIMEFIDLEHTPKNLLIKAIRPKNAKEEKSTSIHPAIERYRIFADHLHILPSLERYLKNK